MGMIDLQKINFILEPGLLVNVTAYGDIIDAWINANSSKKFVVWYDSLADIAKWVFDENVQRNQVVANEIIDADTFRWEYEYVKNLNGHHLIKEFIEDYLKKFKLAISNSRMPDDHNNNIFEIIKSAESDLTGCELESNVKEKFMELKKVNSKPNILELITKKESAIKTVFEKHELFKRVEIKDLYAFNKSDPFDSDLYALYLFEILRNRDQVLAQNLSMYMISEKFRDELVLQPTLYPKLNPDIFSENYTGVAMVLAILKMKNRKIDSYTGSDELKQKIKSTSAANLFTALEKIDNTKIFASIIEAKQKIDYLIFPQELNDSIKEYVNAMCKKRFDQLPLFSLNIIEGALKSSGKRICDSEKVMNNFIKFVVDFRNEIFDNYEELSIEYDRLNVSKYSHYKEYISETIGSKFWLKKNIALNKLNCIDIQIMLPEKFRNSLETIKYEYHMDRMENSSFDLDIFVYFHTVSKNQGNSDKGIFFTYKHDQQKIQFIASGIKLDEKQFLNEADVQSHIQNNSKQGKNIRIQVIGDIQSLSDMIKIYMNEPNVGGLTIENFSNLFKKWFNRYLSGVVVKQIAFVACNLTNFDISNAMQLPEDTFLEKFINDCKQSMICIMEIRTSEVILSVSSFTGQRTKRSLDNLNNDKKMYREQIRKLRIISDNQLPNGRYAVNAIQYEPNMTNIPSSSNTLQLSTNVFDNMIDIHHREVLSVPLRIENIIDETVKVNTTNRHGHSILKADTVALIACTQQRQGGIIIMDSVPERIEAIRFALRTATIQKNYILWKTYLKSYFPNAYKYLEPFITANNFKRLLENISSNITFINSNLTELNDHIHIRNYLSVESGNSSIALMYTPNGETAIVQKLQTHDATFSSERFIFERDAIIARRQLVRENIQIHMRENIKRLMQEDTILIHSNMKKIQTLDQLQIDQQLEIGSNASLDVISSESNFAETFSDTHHLANELHTACQDLIVSHPNQLTSTHVPLLDTLVKVRDGNESYWLLSFIDAKKLNRPEIITIKIKKPIFERVKNFIKSIWKHTRFSVMAGVHIMNLGFGIYSLCHWIEHGFKANTNGISNKTLAIAMEVHFYVNAVGVIQGLAETGMAAGQAIKNAMIVSAIKPYIRLHNLFHTTSGGRMLMSMGRFTSKSLPFIGLILNFADLSLNIIELINNDDPYQRPIIITNTAFSAIGLTISLTSVFLGIAGASTLLGPLVGMGILVGLLALPVTYFVGLYTGHIEMAKNIGSYLKQIVNEIKYGAYQKNDEHHFLAAPSLIPVEELKLFSSTLEVKLGPFKYLPTSNSPHNSFTHWYHIDDKYAKKDANNDIAIIKFSDEIRTLVLPHIPESYFLIGRDYVPFLGSRDEDEFEVAKYLQEKDPGFVFQEKGDFLRFNDSIASHLYIEYEKIEIDISIIESNWKLIFPWSDLSSTTNSKEKEQLKKTNDGISERLQKIVYKLKTKCIGRQYIQMPALECPVNLHLDASNADAIWFIAFFDLSVSNSDLLFVSNMIKFGQNQNIQINGEMSRIYVHIPKYSANNNQMAYFDANEKIYIYNKNWTKKEQMNIILLFSTKNFAFFYQHNVDNSNSKTDGTGTIWGVCNQKKESVIEHCDVKHFEKHGDGLVIATKKGLFYLMVENPENQTLSSDIIGFTVDWFVGKNPLAALKEVHAHLDKVSHTPVVNFYLPYDDNEFKVLNCEILLNTETSRYIIVGAKYAIKSQPRFLVFDDVSQGGFFYSVEQKELIIVKELDMCEASKKIGSADGKIKVNANEPCEKIFNGVLNASYAENGIKVRLTAGLEIVLNRSQTNSFIITIQKLILKDFVDQKDKRTTIALEEAIYRFYKENVANLGEFKINQPPFIAIEYNRKNIGFFEKSQERTLCTVNIPQAYNIIPLGTDNNFAYHILDNNELHQSQYVTHLSEIHSRSNSRQNKKSNNQSKSIFKADSITLFNRTIFLKKDSLDDFDENILKTISQFPEIDLIWIESKKYQLNLDIYKNITISCINLLKIDINTRIEFVVNRFDEYLLQRKNDDMLFYNSARDFTLILKGAFKAQTILLQFACVLFIIRDNDINVSKIPNTFILSTLMKQYEMHDPSYVYDQIQYPYADLLSILKGVGSFEEIEKMFDAIFWPSNQEETIYELLQWVNENATIDKSRYILAYFKNYSDILKKVMNRNNYRNSLLHMAIKDGNSSVIQALFERILYNQPMILKEFVVKVNQENKTAIDYSMISHNYQSACTLFDEIHNSIGNETLKELVLKTDQNGCNNIHYGVKNKNPEAIKVFTESVKRYLSNEILKEMLTKCEKDENTPLHYAAIYDHTETMKQLLETIKTCLDKETYKTFMLKTNKKNQTALSILANKEHSECTKIFLQETNMLFDRMTFVLRTEDTIQKNELHWILTDPNISNPEILNEFFEEKKKNHEEKVLKEMIFHVNSDEQTALHIIILKDQDEWIRVFCSKVNAFFTTEILKEMVKISSIETENVLQFAVYHQKLNSFGALLTQINQYSGNDTLNELLLSTETPFFHYVISVSNVGIFQKTLEEMTKYYNKETLIELILKTNDVGETILI